MNTISAITITNGLSCILKDGQAREDIQHKIWFKDSQNSSYNDLSIIKLTNAEYEQLVLDEKCLSNAIYILSSDYHDAFGKVLSNLIMTDDSIQSEAATQHYVDQLSIKLHDSLSSYGKTIEYDSTDRKLYLKNDSTVLGTVDCNDFIKDGMLSTVQLCGNILIFKFNTDAGLQPISIDLSSFANIYTAGNGLCCENYQFRIDDNTIYTKVEVGQVVAAATVENHKYTDDQISNSLSNYYNISEVSSKTELNAKFSTLSVYSEISNQLSNDGYLTEHQSLSDYYTKTEVGQVVAAATVEAHDYTDNSLSILSAYVETEVIAVDEDEQQFEFTILTKGFN